LHAGKVPEYRGGSPLNWQIIEGKKKIYISILKMTKGIDSGPIYAERSFKLKSSENINDLHKKVNKAYPIMTEKVICKIINNVRPMNQSKKKVRYMRQRNDDDGKINWNFMTSEQVFNLVRALQKPYPCAFYIFNKRMIRISRCKKIRFNKKIKPGNFFFIKNRKFIKCKKDAIEIIKEKKFLL